MNDCRLVDLVQAGSDFILTNLCDIHFPVPETLRCPSRLRASPVLSRQPYRVGLRCPEHDTRWAGVVPPARHILEPRLVFALHARHNLRLSPTDVVHLERVVRHVIEFENWR